MRLFVTGISGFVGSSLARAAAAAGDEVCGIHLGGPPPAAGVDAWEVDLADPAALADAVGRARPDAVLHLGGLSHVGGSWDRMADYFRVNVLGTENLLAAARRAGADRVVFASSAEVYGAVPDDAVPVPESRPVAPASPYAMTKAAAERLAIAAGAVVVRSFNLVGPGQAASFALPSFARQLVAVERGEAAPEVRVGNLSARRDFVHVADGIAAYLLLARRGERGEVYNVASGRAVSIREALDRLIALSGVEVTVVADPDRMRPVDVPVLAGDAGRLAALGWRAEHDLDTALGELLAEARAEAANGIEGERSRA